MSAWSFLTKIFSVAQSVDWSAMVLGTFKALKGTNKDVDSKYIVLKPHALSDDNVLKAVSIVRLITSFIPHPVAMIAGPLLGLGTVGFNLWKRMSSSKEYDLLRIPLADPNIVVAFFRTTPALSKAYPEVVTESPYSELFIEKLEKVYNDVSFITDADLLKIKYPQIAADFLVQRSQENKERLCTTLLDIQQAALKASNSPETDASIRQAFSFILDLFPVMQSWSMFSSENFDSVVEIIDTVV